MEFKSSDLPTISEIDRRIDSTVKDIKRFAEAGHGAAADQYESDLIWLIDLRIRRLELDKELVMKQGQA